MPSTANPTASKDVLPDGSIDRSQARSTTAKPSSPTSIARSTVGASSVPPRAITVVGGCTSRRVVRGGSESRIRDVSGGRLPSRTTASVTALRPSMRTMLSVTTSAATPRLSRSSRAAPIRIRTTPASPPSDTVLPPSCGSASTVRSAASGRTPTEGADREERISTREATAPGIRSVNVSAAAVESTAIRPSSTAVCRRSPPSSGTASNQARYPVRDGSTSTSIRPGPSCRGGAERSNPPSSRGTSVQSPRVCRTVNSTVAGQTTSLRSGRSSPSRAAAMVRASIRTTTDSRMAAGGSSGPESPSLMRNRSTKSR